MNKHLKVSKSNYILYRTKFIRPKSSITIKSNKINKNSNSTLSLRECKNLLRSVNFTNKDQKNKVTNLNKNNTVLNPVNYDSNTLAMFINGKDDIIPKKQFYKIKNLSMTELKIQSIEKKMKLKAKIQQMEKENKLISPKKILNDMILVDLKNKEYDLRNGITRLQRKIRDEKKSINTEKIEELYKIILTSIKNIDKYVSDDINSIKNDINKIIISGLYTCEYALEVKYSKQLKKIQDFIDKIYYILNYMENIKSICNNSVKNLKFQERANIYLKKILKEENKKYNKNLKNIINIKRKKEENQSSPLKMNFSQISTIQLEQSTDRNFVSSSRYMSVIISENKTNNTTNTASFTKNPKNKEKKIFLKNPLDCKKSINENNKNLEKRMKKYKDDVEYKIKYWKNKTEIIKNKIDKEIPNNSIYINTCNIFKEMIEKNENKRDKNFFCNQDFRELFLKNLLNNKIILDDISSDYLDKANKK